MGGCFYVFYLMFHHDKNRSNFVSEHVGIRRGSQPFPCHRNDVKTLRQLVHEPGMPSFDLILQCVFTIDKDLIQGLWFLRQRKIHRFQNLVWVVKIQDFVAAII